METVRTMHPFILGCATFPEDLPTRGVACKKDGQYLISLDKSLDLRDWMRLLKFGLSQIYLGHLENDRCIEADDMSFASDADFDEAWTYADQMTDKEFHRLMKSLVTIIRLGEVK